MAPVLIDDSLDVSYSDAVSFLCRCRYYNPHKKMHSLKAQIVCTWRGEIVCVDYHNMPSPTLRRGMPGGRHDTYYWRVSTAEALRDLTLRPHQRILGDTGYPRVDEDGNVIMIIPEKMSVLRNIPPEHAMSRDARKHRNYTIGSVRVVVEGVFGAVKNLWTLYGRKAIGSIEHDQHARGFAVACALYNLLCRLRNKWPRGEGWMNPDRQCSAWELAALSTDNQLDILDAAEHGDAIPGGGAFGEELMGAEDE